MPYDFFMSRYKEAYKQETLAFVQALRRDEPAPCSGRDGLVTHPPPNHLTPNPQPLNP